MIKSIIKIIIKTMGFFCFHKHYKMKKDERIFFYENDFSGSVILTRVNKCLSNIFIEGYYKHAGLIDGNFVIEAKTKEGVISTPIEKFLSDKDEYVILCKKNSNDEDLMKIVHSARKKIGVGYDMLFEENDDEFYCSEAVYDSIVEADNDFSIDYGGKIILPQDLYNKEKFSIVKEIRKR